MYKISKLSFVVTYFAAIFSILFILTIMGRRHIKIAFLASIVILLVGIFGIMTVKCLSEEEYEYEGEQVEYFTCDQKEKSKPLRTRMRNRHV